jgi:hypothetical protein
MPNLKDLNEKTVPLTLIDGDDPFVANIRVNSRTRSASADLDKDLKGIAKHFEKMQSEVSALIKTGESLDKAEAIENKKAELADATPDGIPQLQAELTALEAEQEANAPQLQAIMEQMGDKIERAEKWAQDMIAKQLAFFIKDTNMRVSDAPDADLAVADEAFWTDNFDRETLEDFASKVKVALSGPLATRVGSTS